MIAFVTSLRHPDNSASYDRVEHLLQRTLRSIEQQTNSDFVVIVVCNVVPSFEVSTRVRFVQVDFPAPAPPNGPQTDRASFVRDKGSKIGVGLIAARPSNPDYVMIFDADDFVSRGLVAFSKAHPGADGWYVSDGWTYSSARGVFKKTRRFNKTCGTSFVMPFAAYGVPTNLDVGASQDAVIEAFGERLDRILGAHRDALEWFESAQYVVERLPFRGSVYHVDTGENHSGKSMTGIAIPASRSLLNEFGISQDRSLLRSAINAFGPLAIVETASKIISRLVRREKSSR